MVEYQVTRSIVIHAPASDIHEQLRNFRHWPLWSPWLCLEPNAHISHFGDEGLPGSGYSWDGNLVGAGKITLMQSRTDALQLELQFRRPFRSQSQIRFELEEQIPGQCLLSWHMQARLPLFMVFLRQRLEQMLGRDFQRGLLMLRDLIETGQVHSHMEPEGVINLPPSQYLVLRGRGRFSTLSETLHAAFDELARRSRRSQTLGEPCCLYPRIALDEDECDYAVAIAVEPHTAVPEGLELWQLPARRALRIRHHGAYHHLGNAWAMANLLARQQKLRAHQKMAHMEVYCQQQGTVPEKALMTEIYLMIR